MDTLQNKDLQYWSKKIKANPENETIFHYWLKALIKEVKEETNQEVVK